MYSRNESFKLKAKSATEFARIFEGEIIPLPDGKKDLRMRSASSLRIGTRRSPSVCGIRKTTRRLIIGRHIPRS